MVSLQVGVGSNVFLEAMRLRKRFLTILTLMRFLVYSCNMALLEGMWVEKCFLTIITLTGLLLGVECFNVHLESPHLGKLF